MASKIYLIQAPTGMTLTGDLFTETSDTAVVTGLTFTEATNAKGWFTTTDTTVVSSVKHRLVIKEGGVAIGSFCCYLTDTANTFHFTDFPGQLNTSGHMSANVAQYGGTNGTFSGGRPEVKLGNIAHGGTASVLTLERVVVASTTSNEPAVKLTGNGTGAGLRTQGGATGAGIAAVGGSTSGAAVTFTNTTGDCFTITASAGNGNAMSLTGQGSGSGFKITAGATGFGLYVLGGSTSGDAVRFTGQAGNSDALSLSATGSGHGILSEGGTSGNGVRFIGGGAAAGAFFDGGATGAGLAIRGGGTSGVGVEITTTSGSGVSITADGNGHGIVVAGDGTGSGFQITAGATGVGLKVSGGVTSGNAVEFTAQGGNSDGLQLTKAGSGLDLDATNLLTDVAAVKTDTAAILLDTGTDGVVVNTFTTAGKAELQSKATDALNAYDPPTKAEMDARTLPAADYFDPANDTVATVTNLTNLPTMPTDWITATGVSAAAVSKIQNGLATSSEVTGLNVNTRCTLLVPIEIETPDSSTQTYKIRLHLFDELGNMEAPDSTPTVALVNAAGTDRSSRLSTASNPSTGVYTWDYTATAGDAEEQLVWTFTVVEGGATRVYPATSYVVEETAYRFTSSDRATLNAAATATALAALDSKVGSPAGASVSADIAAVKAETASIVADTNELQQDWVDGGRLDLLLDDIPNTSEFEARTLDSAAYFDPATDTVTVGTNNDKSGYTISGTLTTLDALDTAQDSQHATTQAAVAGIPSQVRTELATELARIDVDVSSRMATFTYTTPPSVNDIDAQLTSTHGSGSWLTATGFSTFDPSSQPVTLATSQPNYAPAKAGDAMTLTDGAITDEKFTLPTVSGVPTGVVGMVHWIAARLGLSRVVKDSDSITVMRADGTTPRTTNTYTSSGDDDDVGAAT